MGLIVVGAIQQSDAVGADPEILHQCAGTAEVGGAAADLAVACILPRGLTAQPDLAALAQRELLRGKGVKQSGVAPGTGKVDGSGHGQFGHQDAAVGHGRKTVDTLTERAHRALGQELLGIDPAKALITGPNLH